jgi:hypothetical protein
MRREAVFWLLLISNGEEKGNSAEYTGERIP